MHSLACVNLLSATRYTYWKGILESIKYFRGLERVGHPLPRPDPAFDLNSLVPDEMPMLRLNILAKALWEFDKSLRIFMRAAILWRQQNSQANDSNSGFWVESPLFRPGVAMYLGHFIWYRTRLPTYFFDRENIWPPADNASDLKLRINLLDPQGLASAHNQAFDSLWWIWVWMFGPEDGQDDRWVSDWVNELMANHRVSNPPYTSYMFHVAWPWFHNLREWNDSPRIEPGYAFDLRNFQSLSLDE